MKPLMSVLLIEAESPTQSSVFDVVNVFNNISETLQNLIWIIGGLVFLLIIILAVFRIIGKTKKYTQKKIEDLTHNGKYIPGIFVELNDCKEVLRYFIYGKKWKNRIIRRYNAIYDNSYGEILKVGNTENKPFYLSKCTTTDDLEQSIKSELEYHEKFRLRKVKLKEEFSEAEPIFEIFHYLYSDNLEELYYYTKAINSHYLILTGSAGNGKTNLLCSISELLIKLKKPVIFLNARDIVGEIDDYIFKELRLPVFWNKHRIPYLSVLNFILKIKRKQLFFIIDAINENDDPHFKEYIRDFVNSKEEYKQFKIIVSCRNEYYTDRFAPYIAEQVLQQPLRYDLKAGDYPVEAIRRVLEKYRTFFNYTGYVSEDVQHILCEHLLLMRIFFEVNKDSNQAVTSIHKHEVFAAYIKKIRESKSPLIEDILDTITDHMISEMKFDSVDQSILDVFTTEELHNAYDETVLLSKKIKVHDRTIIEKETEEVYFVYDEIRDYYIAKRLIWNSLKSEQLDFEGIIDMILNIHESHTSCEEGILQYVYVYIKTDSIINQQQRKEYCKRLLDIYRITEDYKSNNYEMHFRADFKNYGIRMLFSNGLTLEEFELDYIRDCLTKVPREDGGKIFDVCLDGTLFGLNRDLNLYFNIILGLKDVSLIGKAYSTMIGHTYDDSYDMPNDLIKYHKKLCENNPEKAKQVQEAAELFMLLFQPESFAKDYYLPEYFEMLSNHDEVKEEMRMRLVHAIQ